MKKKTIIIAGIVVVAVAVMGMASLGIAATQGTQSYPPIVQKLAEKFNLKPADVNAVFEVERTERQAQQQQRYEDTLEQAVKDGKITEKQKTAIIAKNAELREKMAGLKDLAPEERRAAMEKQRTELETWAKDNNIDLRYLIMGGKGFGRGGHGPGGFGGPGGCDRGLGGPGFGPLSGAPGAPDGSISTTEKPVTPTGTSL